MQTLSQSLSGAAASPTVEMSGAIPVQALHVRRLEFEDLLARELPRFQKMAMRWLRNREDAEDAVQNAVLSAFVHIASFEGRARMSSWLMSIVINSVRMQLRQKRHRIVPLDQLLEDGSRTVAEIIPDLGPNPEQNCQRSELNRILADSMEDLSPTQRTTLQLFELRELSLKEVAETLGVPVGTVKARLARGRGLLGRKLQKVLGSRTRSSRIHLLANRAALQNNTGSQAAPRVLHGFGRPTPGKEKVTCDVDGIDVISSRNCFAVMEVAVEGSPVPA